jgi:hypothetical protein
VCSAKFYEAGCCRPFSCCVFAGGSRFRCALLVTRGSKSHAQVVLKIRAGNSPAAAVRHSNLAGKSPGTQVWFQIDQCIKPDRSKQPRRPGGLQGTGNRVPPTEFSRASPPPLDQLTIEAASKAMRPSRYWKPGKRARAFRWFHHAGVTYTECEPSSRRGRCLFAVPSRRGLTPAGIK